MLGHLLFLLYINDMVNCINDEDVKLVLYADDTNIFIGNDKNNLIQKGNHIFKAVNEFMKSNLLHTNLDKCYYMHFCPKAVKTKNDNFITEEHDPSSLLVLDNTLNISGTSIPEVNNIKFLGVTIDNQLS